MFVETYSESIQKVVAVYEALLHGKPSHPFLQFVENDGYRYAALFFFVVAAIFVTKTIFLSLFKMYFAGAHVAAKYNTLTVVLYLIFTTLILNILIAASVTIIPFFTEFIYKSYILDSRPSNGTLFIAFLISLFMACFFIKGLSAIGEGYTSGNADENR